MRSVRTESTSIAGVVGGRARRIATMVAACVAAVSAATLAHGGKGGGGGRNGGIAGPPPQLATTLDDFFQPGTQPLNGGNGYDPMQTVNNCAGCHANYGNQDPFLIAEPFKPWASSMMGQSARDPVFYAAMTIANQDAAEGGAYCIRCHAPNAYLAGRSGVLGQPNDGSNFILSDYEGINCNFCHRIIDPTHDAGIDPPQDATILSALSSQGLVPPQGSNSRWIVDPSDSRRGPFVLPDNPHGESVATLVSPFHRNSEFCWSCHDVSNQLMTKQPDGTFALNALGEPHETHDQEHMLAQHRTYSEWKNSYYGTTEGIQHNGRFGGNHPTGVMKTCQDCHMPKIEAMGCSLGLPYEVRPDVPQHSFMGSNSWVLKAIRTQDADGDFEPDFPDEFTGLSTQSVDDAYSRTVDFMQKASDMELSMTPGGLSVRVINKTGHKLPTGFSEGRRIWVNVKFFDCHDELIAEHGAYNFETAELTTTDTKVYESVMGIVGEEHAAAVGLPEGPTMHFLLANAFVKDNRIPPTGWFQTVAMQNQTMPIGANYTSGQHWDDTVYAVPADARTAVVTVYHQTTSKEFIEFLRDSNFTDSRGIVAYDLWVEHGMSPPIAMDAGQIHVGYHPADIDEDGVVGIADLLTVIGTWGVCPDPELEACPSDLTKDGSVGIADLLLVIGAWGSC